MANRMCGHAGGEILMSGSIREAYEHGKGPITVRGKAFIEGTEESEDGFSEASSSAETKPKPTRKKVCSSPVQRLAVAVV